MPDVSQLAGYAIFQTAITIADGKTVSDIADLERSYAFIGIGSADLSNVAASNLSARIGFVPNIALMRVLEANDPATIWSKAMLTSGSMYFILSHAMGARFIELTLSVITTGDIVFDIFGIDQAVESLMS